MARALRTSRPGHARAWGPQATEERVKITAGWDGPRHVLFQACREGSEKHCWRLGGGGAGLTCLRHNPQACREGIEKHCWGGSVGRARSGGADRFI